MLWAARRFDASLAVLVLISLAAWSVLALRWSEVTPPAFCSAGLQPDSTSLLSGWLLMLAAMMPPLVAGPLRHVRERSFASRRLRAMSLFVIGYAAVWMIAGTALQLTAFAAQAAASDARLCFALSASAAMLWQVSPAKQWFLNRCHRRPQLAAFGVTADRAALEFGLTHGTACVGACWALMLLPLFAGQGHAFAMLAVMLFALAERLEGAAPLAWRWRGPGKALRIIAAQTRMHLGAYRRA